MAWLEVRVATAAEYTDALESTLAELGAQAVTLEDDGDQPLLEPRPGETPLWSDLRVVGLFDGDADRATIAAAVRAVGGEQQALEPEFARVADREWSRAWLDDWQPQCFGDRLWVVPRAMAAPGDGVVIHLDPGLAFGTGTHATTALCLEWLAAAPPGAARVLDYGCGSGILAIAALCLGAREVVAVDIDPQALEATRENARINGVAERLRTPDVEMLADDRFDLILANILAGPLIEQAGDFARRQRSGARLVLAGVLVDQADQVVAAYERDYAIAVGGEREGWVRLDGCRR